jgi:predicted DsbA family dithiol-disulfide isomerase
VTSQESTGFIEVFADIWCPFTHVGLRAVRDQLRTKDPSAMRLWVRSWPLEWVNGQAMNPAKVSEHVQQLRRQVSRQLFSGIDAAHFPRSTIPVLALVAKAYTSGWQIGQSISFEVRDWLFETGQDVADPEVLGRLAASFGLAGPEPDDYATVVADWKDGIARGVLGSPHFFCGAANLFCPSLDIAESPGSEGKTIRLNLDRLEAFLGECS